MSENPVPPRVSASEIVKARNSVRTIVANAPIPNYPPTPYDELSRDGKLAFHAERVAHHVSRIQDIVSVPVPATDADSFVTAVKNLLDETGA